jgi:hypothetical protein
LHPYLDSISNEFKGEDFILVTIYIELQNKGKGEWLKILRGGKYTSERSINLRLKDTEPEKIDSFLSGYHVKGYPTIILVDKEGRLTRNPPKPSPLDKGQGLIDLISENL